VLEGEAEITIAGKPHRMQGGEMILMPANQPHALKALKRYKTSVALGDSFSSMTPAGLRFVSSGGMKNS